MILDEFPSGPRLLSYCTNVHPAESVDEILQQLRRHTAPLRRRFADAEVFGLGLRLGARAVEELEEDPETFERLEAFLREEQILPFTINAFPQGAFQTDGLKESVYLPDWSTAERRDYTLAAGRILGRLLVPHLDHGTISTLPLGAGDPGPEHRSACIANLLEVVRRLGELEETTGVRVQVLIEAEPGCIIESTSQMIAFFKEDLLPAARSLESLGGRSGEEQCLRHLGVCYDAAHQAVLFEEASYNLERYEREGIPIGKVQLSCAIELKRPHENPEGCERLRLFDEPRFLHQVVGRAGPGDLHSFPDLGPFFEALERDEQSFEAVRCHFHVPIHQQGTFPIGTTQNHLLEILHRLRTSPEVPHLEVETYTLGILQETGMPLPEMVDVIEAELRFARERLGGSAAPPPG